MFLVQQRKKTSFFLLNSGLLNNHINCTCETHTLHMGNVVLEQFPYEIHEITYRNMGNSCSFSVRDMSLHPNKQSIKKLFNIDVLIYCALYYSRVRIEFDL